MKQIIILLASILLIFSDLSAQDKTIEVNPAEQRFYNYVYVVIGLFGFIKFKTYFCGSISVTQQNNHNESTNFNISKYFTCFC